MNADRVYRIGTPGIVFLLSWLYFYYAIGGDMYWLYMLVDKTGSLEAIVALVGLLITTPVVGQLTSAIAWGIVVSIWDYYRIHLSDRQLREANESDQSVADFYWDHQRLIRERVNEETHKFLVRRWDSFHVHVNSVISIFLGLIMGVFAAIGWHEQWTFLIYPDLMLIIPMLLLIVAYVILGIRSACQARLDAVEIEDRSATRARRREAIV